MSMVAYRTKAHILRATSYGEVRRQALTLYKHIERRTKRRPYLRSAYFKRQKVFFDFFWDHLAQKGPKERYTRLKYFAAALDVIRESKQEPASQENPHKRGEILHRFAALTREGDLFYVQIKEDKRTGQKYFMSCFPEV